MSTTRFGNLGRVFREGESDLLNAIARLAILYEDLRLELGELQIVNRKRVDSVELGGEDEYRFMYFLRRALVTVIEFRCGLTIIRKTSEFKQAEGSLLPQSAKYILQADQYLQQNGKRLKELRNEFGGHVQPAGVDFATRHLSNVTGKVTWSPSSDGWTTALECGFSGHIMAQVIAGTVRSGTDVRKEFANAIEIVGEAFNHAQAAMVELTRAFLWDRFGK